MFGAAHPWILAGLAAIGLPILIHFLTRARPRPIRYPTFHLLVEVGSGRQALSRLRTWIILLLRALAVAALVLVFAQPFLKTPGADATPGEARRVVLVVDASMSMRAVEGGIPVFTKARAQAADLLRSLEKGSSAAIVFIGAKPRTVLPALSRNLAALHEGLAGADATLEAGDPAAALALADRMLEGQGAVYVFSDFQRTNWASVSFDPYKRLSFFLRPVVARGVDNVGLTAVEKMPGEPTENETIELAATLFNATAAKRLETVRLDLEGVTREAAVELQPFSSGVAGFSFSLPAAGCFPGRLSLPPDALSDDNTRYFKIRVRRALQVLLISDADRQDRSSAAYFVATALAPSKEAATGMNVITRHSQEVDRTSLETADIFFIVAPARLGGDTIDIISRRVTEGAHLACFLDGPTSPPLVAALAGASKGMIAPPFRLDRPVLIPRGMGEPFGQVLTARGPMKVFGSPDQGDLAGWAFRRHFMTAILAERKDEVLAQFPDGSAALSLSPAGRGMAVFANFPVALDGSDIAGSPLFPILLQELMRSLRTTGGEGADTPGRPWNLDVLESHAAVASAPATMAVATAAKSAASTPASADTSYAVKDPGGKELETVVISRGRTVRLGLPPAAVPGHYPVSAGGAVVDVGVVNVDAKETDTRQMNMADLLSPEVAPQGGAVSLVNEEGQLASVGRPTLLWPYLAALVVICLAAEMLLLAFWRRPSPRSSTALRQGAASGEEGRTS
jgi:hypothetical protein